MNGKSIGHHLAEGFGIETFAYSRIKREIIYGKEGFLC
jgi:hypothetical protein